MATKSRKIVIWTGDSRKRLRQFPEEVRSEIGYAIFQAECGESHLSAKRMQGYNAVEIVSDNEGDTFRAVYTTQFEGAVYVLHCFQKKSKKGGKTPQPDLDLIKKRLRDAKRHYEASRRHGPEN
jgi:phage-related protein